MQGYGGLEEENSERTGQPLLAGKIHQVNKLMMIVLNLDQMIHAGPEHFKILNWLPVIKRVDQIILCRVCKIKPGTASGYLGE